MKVGKESGSRKSLAATAQNGKAQLAYEYLHLNSQPRPGIWGHRRPARTHAGPQPSPKFHPLHSAPGTRSRFTATAEQTTELLLHAFVLSAPQRSTTACESVACCIDSWPIPSLSSCFSSPRRTRQAVRQSVSAVLNRTVDAPLRCPLHPMRPSSLTPSAPNKLPRIQGFQGRRSCCC